MLECLTRLNATSLLGPCRARADGRCCWVTCTFYVLGALLALRFALRVLGFVYRKTCKRALNLRKYGAGSGAWAVVTGATDGIGLGFAQVLAKRGFNIVLVSRSIATLQTVAQSIEKECQVRTKVVACDARNPASVAAVMAAVSSLDVGVLINNVGVNTPKPTELKETSEADVDAMIAVNVHFTTKLTKAMIPILKRRAPVGEDTPLLGSAGSRSNRALIMNVSSTSGTFPVPMMSVYSATKAYSQAFSRALARELRAERIDVVATVPHYVASKMSGFRNPSLMVAAPRSFANAALSASTCCVVSTPYWSHEIFSAIVSCLPASLVSWMTYRMMKKARERIERREKREADGKSQ